MTTPKTRFGPSPALSGGRGKRIQQLRMTVATPAPDKIHYSQADLAMFGISLSFSSLFNRATSMEFFQPLDEYILNDCALDMEWLGEHDAPLVALKDLDVTESFPSDNGVPRGERASFTEWIKPGKDKTPGPHLRIATINYGLLYEDRLLVSELSAIAQVLEKRVHQPQLQETIYFPVLLISLFGPRNGRIVQAHYDAEQDTLELEVSPNN
ncbi:hypothetical protein PENDEC_c023G00917 [Penicillium decumbens]|uniref:Uncharacterized protein n=1 Tax=Penicillium decumbens TaxID=69771 RepID=A0A1V6P0M9_PENDC|nr:hypothetical protein PENDEC_c023G00917 [Penicillium decumbens]